MVAAIVKLQRGVLISGSSPHNAVRKLAALGANFWKPIEVGLEAEPDAERVARLGRLPSGRIVPEPYRLQAAVSPYSPEIDEARTTPEPLDVTRL
ncbi:AAA family ATPase [Bradyrhizobium sp. B124]|uniref:AAA family ATPase n=1 Tax=Bradyrhizobium sp. B124 TaxID=3140245 RepID=UPI0031842A44